MKPLTKHTDEAIKRQSLEFIITLIEHCPSIVKKDEGVIIKDLLQSIFELMIDIEAQTGALWQANNKEKIQEDEEENIKFG